MAALLPLLLLLPCLSLAATLGGRVEVWEKVGAKVIRLEDHSNAVVFVSGFSRSSKPAGQPQLIQRNKGFSTRVLVITRGDTVEFPNHDPIFHNVWSKSRARAFDLGLYKHPDKKSVTFSNLGIVTVFCNIHPQMISTILVLPNDRFALTEKDGSYRIGDIPAGEHTVYAWVEGARPIKQKVEFREGKTVRLDLKLLLNRIPLRHLNKEGRPYKKYPG